MFFFFFKKKAVYSVSAPIEANSRHYNNIVFLGLRTGCAVAHPVGRKLNLLVPGLER